LCEGRKQREGKDGRNIYGFEVFGKNQRLKSFSQASLCFNDEARDLTSIICPARSKCVAPIVFAKPVDEVSQIRKQTTKVPPAPSTYMINPTLFPRRAVFGASRKA
jgi:hypothetical protein